MERKCLADERKDLHPFHYGRDSGHGLGFSGLGDNVAAGSAAQRFQYGTGPKFLGQSGICYYGFYHNYNRRLNGDRQHDSGPPPRRPLTPSPEETARRQKS